jgi:hypothetical protein
MNIFLRTFNNKINSKTGASLPLGKYRGTPEWMEFQGMLKECLQELGHRISYRNEGGPFDPISSEEECLADKRIYVHQCKKHNMQGDLFWMQMHMKYLFTLDTMGWGADNSQLGRRGECKDEEGAKEFCEALSKSLCKSGQSKCEQPNITSETPNNFILVPVQIPRDYTILHHSPITVKYFIESIQAWANEASTEVCFKMHPNNKYDLDLHAIVDEAARVSPLVHKVEGNIHELIKRSRGVFVINSGTGFEALVHGKPVCTFGNCDYNVVSHNADIRRLDEARDFIYSYEGECQELGYKFVKWYHEKYAYDVRDKDECKRRLTEYLKEKL